jgi:hypothetical protein
VTPLSQYLMIGKLVALLGAIAIICWQSSQIHRWHKHYESEHTARLADRATYEQAQKDAARLNQQQIQHVKHQQQEISDATVATLNSRLELIHSELRKQSNAAPPHPSAGPTAGNASEAPCTVNDPAWMCLSPADRLLAAENEERHDELIDWNLKQSELDPNK